MSIRPAGKRSRLGGDPDNSPSGSLAGQSDVADLNAVLADELELLREHRHPELPKNVVQRSLIGLALSGGGIRSATISLGFLQALSRMRVLPAADYVSTVSGGGYAGACMASLLSWNGKSSLEGKGCEQFAFDVGDAPAFTTAWKEFPFREEEIPNRARVGKDLTAHLRTHGNFLIARWGLLRRETMRGVGNLVTSIVYNVLIFLLTIFALSALYLTLVLAIVPRLPEVLGEPASRTATPADTPARGPLVAEDSTVVRVRGAQCSPSSPDCAVETRTTISRPTLWRRVSHNARTMGAVFLTSWKRWLKAPAALSPREWWASAPAPFRPLLVALAIGALVALFTYAWMKRALGRYLQGASPGLGGGGSGGRGGGGGGGGGGSGTGSGAGTGSGPGEGWVGEVARGESEEDAFERSVLRQLAWIALAISSLTFGILRWLWDDLFRDNARLVRLFAFNEDDQLVWLFVPFAVLAGARVVSFLIAVLLLPHSALWTRRLRSLWGSFQAITIYGWWLMLLVALLPVAIYALRNHTVSLGFGAIGSMILTRLLESRKAQDVKARLRLPPSLRNALLGILVTLVLLLSFLSFAAFIAGHAQSWLACALIAAPVLVALGVFAIIVDHNRLGPYYFYSDRIAETYLLSEVPDRDGRVAVYRDHMEMPLKCLHGDADSGNFSFRNTAPYHLISAAINLAGSRDLTRKDRKSGYWLFSKLYCGSTHTGFRRTGKYRDGETTLARASAVSGAAVSSGIGRHTFFAQAFATVLFNLRLGSWMENPMYARSATSREGGVFWPSYLWRELTMDTTETTKLVNLSDGGHTGDNVGIYPLLQRRCKVIIALDAERDTGLTFGSFTEALRHAYVDLGTDVDIDLTMIRPDPTTGMSRSHCAVGRIKYEDRTDQESYLIYVKSSLVGDEPEPVLNYKSQCPSFPHESTADQFFDDAQFESYRALGVHLAEHTFGGWVTTPNFDRVSRHHTPQSLAWLASLVTP